jgi:hypothetical protein
MNLMRVNLVIFPADDGLNVVVWGKWATGSMRVRHFENRAEMVAELQALSLIQSDDAKQLDEFVFTDSCPLYTAEIDEAVLEEHGFGPPTVLL